MWHGGGLVAGGDFLSHWPCAHGIGSPQYCTFSVSQGTCTIIRLNFSFLFHLFIYFFASYESNDLCCVWIWHDMVQEGTAKYADVQPKKKSKRHEKVRGCLL